MSQTVKNIIILGAIALLIFALFYKENQIRENTESVESTEELLGLSENRRDSLSKRVSSLQSRNEELEKENSRLRYQNKLLRDSVIMLNKRIKILNQKLKEQTESMVANRDELNKLKAQSAQLVAEVKRLKGKKGENDEKIRKLDEERLEIDRKIGEVFTKNTELEEELLENVVKNERLKSEHRKKERTLDIINQVSVNFASILPRNDKDKRARNQKQWHYTLVNLSLEFPDSLIIPGEEEFLIKIINKDDGNVISPRESNIGKDAQGIPFTFTSNPVPEIKYVNYQGKEGKNYMVQAYYMKEGKQYPLVKGTKDISFKKQKED